MPWKQKTHGQRISGKRIHVDRRPKAVKALYGSARWKNARAAYLRDHPMCVHFSAEGRDELANVVDHVVPHKGDEVLFWDVSNWSAVCRLCHDRLTVKYDGGFGNAVKPKPKVDEKSVPGDDPACGG